MSQREPIYNEPALARMFRDAELDAIIARSGQSVTYLSGLHLPGTLGRLQDLAESPRAALLVLAREGEAVLIVSQIASGLARETSWIEHIATYAEYDETPYEAAEAAIRELGLARSRIGVERRAIAVQWWESLTSRLPESEFVDCSEMLERVRSIKTDAEVALLKRAASIQDEAFLEAFATATSRSTERALHAEMIRSMLRRGTEGPHGMMQASSTLTPYGGERDVRIERGDLIRTDYVCYYEGYPANLSRMAVMGAPTRDQETRYAVLRDIHYETIESTLRPGFKASEVYEFVRRRCEEAGVGKIPALVGHSLGVWWHQEQPFLVPSDDQELRTGMVICLEPVIENFWHVQDEVLITDGAPTILSDVFDTTQLYRIG
jgi:Xaa-Pro dipeptidase